MLQVTQEQYKDIEAYFDESPQTVKVFTRILSKYTEKKISKLVVAKENIDIYRAQGALDIIKDINNLIETIKGNK